MSIVQTQTTSFKAELYQGIHDLTTDVIKIALYDGNANLNADTTVYSSSNEIVYTGYTAGGKVMTGITVNVSGYTAYVGFDNVTWDPGAFTARCALIYNSSKGDKSVAVLDFGSDKTTTATFTITMPANTATAALIRSSI
jgi:hypothetical protein